MSKRVVTFGKQPETKPKGMLAEVHYPMLAKLDEGTSEGQISRILSSEGGNVRALPRTIYHQSQQADGHLASVAVGALHEVTLDGESGVLSGKGWILASDAGQQAALEIATQTLFHNSVDLSETKVEITEQGSIFDGDYHADVEFVEWSLAATTHVGKPAFADAYAEMPDFELTAAIEAGPLVVDGNFEINIIHETTDLEIAASSDGLPPWDYFHRPEPELHHKIVVGEADADGWIPVYGHLGLWNTCHDGIEASCTIIPRPQDNYASFNKPSVLTDRGQVEAGPISLFGGHIPLHKAADDPANAWCDVRVTAGVHGPWLSGVVRPSVAMDDAKVYVARASRISGHWKGNRLKMIVCCNSEGFDVPGSGFATDADGHVTELVASYPACQADRGDLKEELYKIMTSSSFEQIDWDSLTANTSTYGWDLLTANTSTYGQDGYITQSDRTWTDTSITFVPDETGEEVEEMDELDKWEFDAIIERKRRERLLALEDE